MRTRPTAAALALCAAVWLLTTWNAPIAQDCEADVTAELTREEPNGPITHLQFRVDVQTGESCAEILFDVVLDVQLANQQVKKVRKPSRVRLSDGGTSQLVEHTLKDGSTLIDYEAKLVRCEPCDMGVD